MLNSPVHFHRIFLFLLLVIPLLLLSSYSSINSNLDDDVLKYTNQLRRSKGLALLVMRSDLNEMARKHSEDMAKGHCDFGHEGFDKRYARIKKIFQSCTVAENVAYGAQTAKEVVEQWKNSSAHRTNMLGNYKYIGIGTARDKRGNIYYTQLFVR